MYLIENSPNSIAVCRPSSEVDSVIANAMRGTGISFFLTWSCHDSTVTEIGGYTRIDCNMMNMVDRNQLTRVTRPFNNTATI